MSVTVHGVRALSKALLVLAAFALVWAGAAPALAAVTLSKEQEKRLLHVMNSSNEKNLAILPGVSQQAARKIVAHRKTGKEISSTGEIREVGGLNDTEMDALLTRFSRLQVGKGNVAERSEPAKTNKKRQGNSLEARMAARAKGGTSAKEEQPPAEGTGTLNLEVRAKYYSILPGYDLSVLSDKERHAFLEAINTEMCPCGCQGETLGYCLVNDPGCMVVRSRVRKIYMDITGKEPVAPAGDSGK